MRLLRPNLLLDAQIIGIDQDHAALEWNLNGLTLSVVLFPHTLFLPVCYPGVVHYWTKLLMRYLRAGRHQPRINDDRIAGGHCWARTTEAASVMVKAAMINDISCGCQAPPRGVSTLRFVSSRAMPRIE